jgi:hypothetical protein
MRNFKSVEVSGLNYYMIHFPEALLQHFNIINIVTCINDS